MMVMMFGCQREKVVGKQDDDDDLIFGDCIALIICLIMAILACCFSALIAGDKCVFSARDHGIGAALLTFSIYLALCVFVCDFPTCPNSHHSTFLLSRMILLG